MPLWQILGGTLLSVFILVFAVFSLAVCDIFNMFHMSQRIVTSSSGNDFYVFRIITDVTHQTCAKECAARGKCFAVNVPIHFNICYLVAMNQSQSSIQPEVEIDPNFIFGIKQEWPAFQAFRDCNCPYDETCVPSQSSFTCTVTECGLPVAKPNARHLGNVLAVNTKIAYICQGSLKMNFKWEASNIAVCLENGTWNVTDFTCTVCYDGYFGTNCDQMCHCLDNRICDHETGRCPDDHCAYGWTGTSCNITKSLSRGMDITLSTVFGHANYRPEFAVDGKLESKTRPAEFCNCCAATVHQTNPWLLLDLGTEYQIQTLHVYGRDRPPESFNKVEIYLHVLKSDLGDILRTINTDTIFINETFSNHPAQYVTLLQRKRWELLVICEINVYGICPDGRFGQLCERTCHCEGPPCDDEGVCEGNCSKGYAGLHCDAKDIGYPCKDNSTCSTDNSFCNTYNDTCTCNVSFSYHPMNHTCVEVCEDYGTDFTRISGFTGGDLYITHYNISTADSCEAICIEDPDCKSYTLQHGTEECILHNDTIDIAVFNGESTYGTRNCQSN